MKVVLLTACEVTGAHARPLSLAAELAEQGHDVALVLLEDAVTATRIGHSEAAHVQELLVLGASVMAERDSLAVRAIDSLGEGIKQTDYGEIADLLMSWSERQAWL